MNFDPQKLFIGLMDFFSILLPGALLTYLLMGEVGPLVLGDRYAQLAEAQGWAAFLLASYLFGHLVFLLGAWLDEFYDWARSRTLNEQIRLLARRDRLLPWFARAMVWLVFKGERNLALQRATRIKQQALGALRAKDAINTFQWSKAWLAVESPESLSLVQRFEADSKFFRSFTVVLVILAFTWSLQPWPLAGLPVLLVLLLLALWRYMEQRFKATNQAYWSVITLTARGGNVTLNEPAPATVGPTHAGGVVYRMRGGQAQYLLVEATRDPTQWVLPKGHVESDESHRETAIREVREEAGTWARVVHDMGDVSYALAGGVLKVRFFLMQAVGRGLQKDAFRAHVWLALPKALEKVSHDEARALLQAAEMQRGRP